MYKYTIIIILYYLFMIDPKKHAYMLQCYKCYKCYIRGDFRAWDKGPKRFP